MKCADNKGSGLPLVSVIIPCRQEAAWIGRCLDSVLDGDYPTAHLEVLVVDGMSTDGTRDVVARYAERFACVRLIDNPRRTTPVALNLGIRYAKGAIIARVDAHAIYPLNYISQLVEWLRRSGADNVGGIVVTRPGSAGPMARAIACALAHPFGVGNSYFRIGVGEPRFVDTVPFGCYPREVFERVGLFDEEMVRNQDDEFNMRLLRAGGRILLVPDIKVDYIARNTLGKVARMYFQYGTYKPLVAVKLGGIFTLRQLIPPAFVLSVSALAMGALWWSAARAALAGVVGLYLITDVLAALAVRGRLGMASRALLCMVFPTLHLSYGLGYFAGFRRLLSARPALAGDDARVEISR